MKVAEANLSQAMKFAFDRFIAPYDKNGILAYKPVTQKSDQDKTFLRDNPTTGLIYLKKHPNVREAWVLVKFLSREATYGQTSVPQDRTTIRTIQEFENFFGVKPTKGFTSDTVVLVNSNYQKQTNLNPKRDFDETTPDFYMYTNHSKVNREKLVKRLYRINDIIESLGGTEGSLYNLPLSPTNIK